MSPLRPPATWLCSLAGSPTRSAQCSVTSSQCSASFSPITATPSRALTPAHARARDHRGVRATRGSVSEAGEQHGGQAQRRQHGDRAAPPRGPTSRAARSPARRTTAASASRAQRGHHAAPVGNAPVRPGGEELGVALRRPVDEQCCDDRDHDLDERAVQARGHHDRRAHDGAVDRVGELPLVRPAGAERARGRRRVGLAGSGAPVGTRRPAVRGCARSRRGGAPRARPCPPSPRGSASARAPGPAPSPWRARTPRPRSCRARADRRACRARRPCSSCRRPRSPARTGRRPALALGLGPGAVVHRAARTIR